MSKKLLYVELGTSHSEIIHSFCEVLSDQYEITLAINKKTNGKNLSQSRIKNIIFLEEENILNAVIKIKKELNPDLILLNSSQGRQTRNLCLKLLFDKTEVVGIHHNPENLYASFTQKLINLKIKKYFVLADFIKKHLENKISNSIQVESLYPVYYPAIKNSPLAKDEKYICIPGVLEQDRRDYIGLIRMVAESKNQLASDIKFVLLGNATSHNGPEIKNLIQEYKISDRFILFDHYVDDEVLFSYVKSSLALMPLLDPGTRWFEKYFETKISGCYSLAFAFQKPLLMNEVFKDKEEFSGKGVFYSAKNFTFAVKSIENSHLNLKDSKFDLGFQKEKAAKFLFSSTK